MRARLGVLIAFVVVVGACSDPVESEEYLALQDAVAQLESDIQALTADLGSARSELGGAEGDVADLLRLRDELTSLLDDIEAAREEEAALTEETEALDAEAEALAATVIEVDTAVQEAMADSSAFARWVKDQNRVADRWECANDVISYFRFFGGFQEMPDLLMDAPPDASELLVVGREVLDLPVGDGCDGWYPGATGGVWSASTVFDKLCQKIDIDLLAESPEEVTGDCVSGWGHVILFDQDLEPCRLEANIGEVNTSKSAYEVWVEFRDPTGADCDWLFGLDKGDEFRFWAVQDGITTTVDENGDSAAIPTFNLLKYVYWYRVG